MIICFLAFARYGSLRRWEHSKFIGKVGYSGFYRRLMTASVKCMHIYSTSLSNFMIVTYTIPVPYITLD